MTGAPQEWASAAGEPREDQEVNDAALTGLNAEAGLFSKGQANLTKNERELYRWILTSFGAGRQPGPLIFPRRLSVSSSTSIRPWSVWRPPI